MRPYYITAKSVRLYIAETELMRLSNTKRFPTAGLLSQTGVNALKRKRRHVKQRRKTKGITESMEKCTISRLFVLNNADH